MNSGGFMESSPGESNTKPREKLIRKYNFKELQKYLGEHDCGIFGRFKLRGLRAGILWEDSPKIVEGKKRQLEEIAKTVMNFCSFLTQIGNTIKKYEITTSKEIDITLKLNPWTDGFGKYRIAIDSKLGSYNQRSNFFYINTKFFYLRKDKMKGEVSFFFDDSSEESS